MTLTQYIKMVPELNGEAMEQARKRQEFLVKPPGSLGRLEELSIQMAGITGKLHNEIREKCLIAFAADNGVVAEGVACAPQSVTKMLAVTFAHQKTGAAVLAKHFGCRTVLCDIGVNGEIHDTGVINCKIAYGTKNIAKEPAMTREQALQAMETGAQLALKEAQTADVLGVGEMGIGNTTTSSAVLAVLLGVDVEEVTGKGAGATQESFAKKKEVIRRAIETNKPDPDDVIDVLSKVGGFDLCAMCGAFIGAAAGHRPVVVDGFISIVAALCAVRLCPNVRSYLVPSHASYEIGYRLAAQELHLEPMLLMNMRLGEGSGCPLAFEVLGAACAVLNDMATFREAQIGTEYMENIRGTDAFTVEKSK